MKHLPILAVAAIPIPQDVTFDHIEGSIVRTRVDLKAACGRPEAK